MDKHPHAPEEAQTVVIVDNPPEMGTLPGSAMVEVDKVGTAVKVQTAFVMAKRFPRNEQVAIARITQACKRSTLAKIALYRYPRGSEVVMGPSIRLAEVLAQSWGNLDFGVREVEHVDGLDGRSVVEAYCTDLETNTHQSRTFTVHHKRDTKKGMKLLTDPRDVYEHVANYGARRMRAAILGIIPRDVVDAAVAQIIETQKAEGRSEPMIDRVNRMVKSFTELGVSVEMLERRLGHLAKDINEDELIELRATYTSLKDGESTREQWFDLRPESDGGKADELNTRPVKAKKEPKHEEKK